MKREIKFRAKGQTDGKLHYGLLVYITDTVCHIKDKYTKWICDAETVGQYTRLKDKNGKEIYEGDVIQSNNNKVDLCQVSFGEFPVYDMETEEVTDIAHGWYAKVIPTDVLSKLVPFCYDRVINNQWIGALDMEVIGNIHDNPELISQSPTETE